MSSKQIFGLSYWHKRLIAAIGGATLLGLKGEDPHSKPTVDQPENINFNKHTSKINKFH
jgi:hypothetical protein